MFDQLDATLGELLHDGAMQTVLPELYGASVSFATPEKGYPYSQETVNLFLYETKENRELRSPLPDDSLSNGLGVRRRAPLRVDCSYMVTTWSKDPGAQKIVSEHQLLGQAFNWLSRFPVIPDRFLSLGGLLDQVFEPPTMVAQMDGAKSAGEFWVALGIAPRPYFNLMVTISMDLAHSVEDTLVTTLASRYRAADPASLEERMLIGGTVRDRNQQPVPDAWVRLEPVGETAVTNALGRFVFDRATRGSGYTLRARAPGFAEAVRTPLEVPSLSGEYDLTFL
jgi:hypothetical protein